MEGRLHFVLLSLIKNCFLFQKFMLPLATLLMISAFIMLLHVAASTSHYCMNFLCSHACLFRYLNTCYYKILSFSLAFLLYSEY